MNFDEIKCGLQVKVIDFGSVHEDRPEHWAPEMEEWQGAVVTIVDCDGDNVYIEEDEGKWSWAPSDFESCCNLDHNDPNLVYKRHISDRYIKQIRAAWHEKQGELRKKGLLS